ncbi:MAG: DUF2339 domain-containing protein [Chloroflexi bacterium]|nr:DUF2339 domain-containing protein [Chloroflexota bacterium]
MQQSDEENRRLPGIEQNVLEMRRDLDRLGARLRAMEDWAIRVSSYYSREDIRQPASERLEKTVSHPVPPPAPWPVSPPVSTPVSWPVSPPLSPTGSPPNPGAFAGTSASATVTRSPLRPTSRSEVDLETVVGGSWLNRIGAVSLVLGLAFFLKLAVEHGWVTHSMQVGVGILLGVGLIGAAEKLRRHGLAGYSHGLTGAGFAALYISVYSAYGPYHLIGFALAFTLLAGITAATVARAVALDAEVVAALGTLCGFLTPIVLSGNGGGADPSSTAKLFTYLWILDAGVLAAACFKDWKRMKLGSLALTQAFFGAWLALHYTPALLFSVTMAATAFFILFVGLCLVDYFTSDHVPGVHVAGSEGPEDAGVFMVVENPLIYAVLMAGLYAERWPQWLGAYSLALAAIYAGLTLAVLKRRGAASAVSVSFLAVSVGFLTGAVPLLLGGEMRTAAWSAEGLALYLGGCSARNTPLRSAGYVLYTLLAVSLAVSLSEWSWAAAGDAASGSFFTMVELPFLLVIASALAAECVARRHISALPVEELVAQTMFGGGAYLGGLVWITAEVFYRCTRMSDPVVSAWFSVAWTLYAGALLSYGVAARRQSARVAALLILGVVISKVFLFDIWLLDSMYRVISLFVLAAVLWGASYLYARFRDRIRNLVLKDD